MKKKFVLSQCNKNCVYFNKKSVNFKSKKIKFFIQNLFFNRVAFIFFFFWLSLLSNIPILISFLYYLFCKTFFILFLPLSTIYFILNKKKTLSKKKIIVVNQKLRYFFILHFTYFLFSIIPTTVNLKSSTTNRKNYLENLNFETNFNNQQSLKKKNPLLKHFHQTAQTNQENLCHIWNSYSPTDLCSKGRWARLKLMRQISLFSRDCDIVALNMQLGELFRLEWAVIKSENDLILHSKRLKAGVQAQDCLLGASQSQKCLACFQRLNNALEQVDKAYRAFEKTLERFDCLLAVDSSTATRPFSPNGTCIDCKIWYRRWLLIQLVNVWKDPPCINWCYYAQLACPHFGTSKVVDFGGHPAFLCRDLNIPQSSTGSTDSTETDAQSCHCIHPCDLQRNLSFLKRFKKSKEELALISVDAETHDFYPSLEHCYTRRKKCNLDLDFNYSKNNVLIELNSISDTKMHNLNARHILSNTKSKDSKLFDTINKQTNTKKSRQHNKQN